MPDLIKTILFSLCFLTVNPDSIWKPLTLCHIGTLYVSFFIFYYFTKIGNLKTGSFAIYSIHLCGMFSVKHYYYAAKSAKAGGEK